MIEIYLLAGVLLGLLATLFGFGGGFIVVPLLFGLLPHYGVPRELAMHMALGTSLMLMFINMCYATRLHYLRRNIDVLLIKKMLIFVVVGAVFGSVIACLLDADSLKYIFIILLFIVLLKNLKQEFFKKKNKINRKPDTFLLRSIGFITGLIAALLGIGGSVIIVPFFRHFNFQMNKSSAIATALAIPSGFIGSIIFAIAGLHTPGLPPYSTGYLYWPALICIFLGSVLGSQLGMYFSNAIPDKIYGKIYCLLLMIVIFCMTVD